MSYTIYKEELTTPEVLRDALYGIKPKESLDSLRKRVGDIIDLSRKLFRDYEAWVNEKRARSAPADACTTYDDFIMYCACLLAYSEAIKDPYYFEEYRGAEVAIGTEKVSQKDKELFAKSCVSKLDAAVKELGEMMGVLKSNRRMFK